MYLPEIACLASSPERRSDVWISRVQMGLRPVAMCLRIVLHVRGHEDDAAEYRMNSWIENRAGASASDGGGDRST
jgi:hypothetical protein